MDLPQRKKPATLPVLEVENRSIIIFLTICTKDRKPILANRQNHECILEAWKLTDFWTIGRYVIMPDHIHLFCSPNRIPPTSLKDWIMCWKRIVSRSWKNSEQKPIWQTRYWDRQMRQSDSYFEKWSYVQNNPVRAGLVSDAQDWPFQGELNKLHWHD